MAGRKSSSPSMLQKSLIVGCRVRAWGLVWEGWGGWVCKVLRVWRVCVSELLGSWEVESLSFLALHRDFEALNSLNIYGIAYRPFFKP